MELERCVDNPEVAGGEADEVAPVFEFGDADAPTPTLTLPASMQSIALR